MNYHYIAIEGNIGVGKSTLANLLAQHYNSRLVLEEFADNNFLPKFYHDVERYAFPLELSFLADRFKQLKQFASNHDLFQETVISDYILTKSKLFARVNLKDQEYELFQRLFDITATNLPSPDLLIYLHAPVNKLMQNIRQRGRTYEQSITAEYLERVQQVYQQYIKQEIQKTLIIDTSSFDFVNEPENFSRLLQFLDKDYDFNVHYLNIEDY